MFNIAIRIHINPVLRIPHGDEAGRNIAGKEGAWRTAERASSIAERQDIKCLANTGILVLVDLFTRQMTSGALDALRL